MIDFRYHLVSIIAIFLALAVGIALGAGPLDQPVNSTVQSSAHALAKEAQTLRAQNQSLGLKSNYQDDLLAAAAPQLVGSLITDSSVAVLALPGAGAGDITSAKMAITSAGGHVTGTVKLRSDWVNGEKTAELDALLVQLTADSPTSKTDPQATVRIATALASSLVTAIFPGGRIDATSQSTLRQLQVLGYLSFDGEPWRRANYAVVVAPKDPVAEATEAEKASVIAITRVLDTLDHGTVVVGPTGSADVSNAVVAQVRNNEITAGTVSTVDDIDLAAGRISLAVALLGERSDVAHHYGWGKGAGDTVTFEQGRSDGSSPSATPDSASPKATP